MRVLVATVQVPFTRGGAEILAEELVAALREAGHEADVVAPPFKWYPAPRVADHVLGARLLDLSEVEGVPVDRLIGLKFPAYYAPHPRKVLWILHQHRAAYDLWDQPLGDLVNSPDGAEARDLVRRCDARFLPEARAIYTISGNVSRRLRSYCGIPSTPLYHPPRNAGQFHCGPAEGYLFFPSRINALKRQELVLEALAHCDDSVRVRFAGRADRPALLDALRSRAVRLGVEHKVAWLGTLSDEEMVAQYAGCRGVVYPPVDEDYGYVTLEAMLSAKPVVTCRDSGGSLEFVADGATGLVVDPAPEALGAAMGALSGDPARAASMGLQGRERYVSMGIGWAHVVETLLS